MSFTYVGYQFVGYHLAKSLSIWDSFDLDWEFFVENLSINVKFNDDRKGEITAGAYLVSISIILIDTLKVRGTELRLLITTF